MIAAPVPGFREKWEYRLKWANCIIGAVTLLAVIAYATIAYKQWDAAQGQLNLLSKERRAWTVSAPIGEYTFDADKEVRINVIVKNFGKIPAVGVWVSYTVAVFPWPSHSLPKSLHTDAPPQPFITLKHENILIGPNDIAILYAFFKVGADVARDIPMGSKSLVMFGRVVYTDDSQTKGDTGFCRVYEPRAKSFNYCPTVADWAK